MKRLSKPLSGIDGPYEAIVVGSGYGGGVAASRLARMGLRVALLERGEEKLPGEFPDTPAEAIREIAGPFGRRPISAARPACSTSMSASEINVLVGCGLGGTSLINANVSLKADPRLFADPVWPAGVATTISTPATIAR